jgi:solute carrier family 36 (proton-coupled amino acid transporter)
VRCSVERSSCLAGVYKTLANIFISFIGAGILGLPYAFMRAGLVLGTLFMICLSILAFYCIMLLVDCKKALEHRGVVRVDAHCK